MILRIRRYATTPAQRWCWPGPGSGKTRVITERVRYLISKCKVRPEHILVVTFTKAAAIEMKERYISSYGNAGVWFGTFHSIFFLILRSAYGYSASDIIKEDEKRKVISDAFGHFDSDNDSEKDIITDIINEISFVKSKRYDIDSYYSLKCSAEQFQYIYRQYDKYLRKKRKIDFDDMLVYTYELFAARKTYLPVGKTDSDIFLLMNFRILTAYSMIL